MPNRAGFQTFVNNELPRAVPGDFASQDPLATVIGGPGQFVAPAVGTTVGVFAWFDPVTGLATNYFKPSAFLGFVHRCMNALITDFLGYASVKAPQGSAVDGFSQGAFYGLFASGGTAGQKVYADPLTGALTADATGSGVTASAASAATITSGVLTTTDADVTGTIDIGQIVTSSVGVPDGTYIASSGGTGSGTHIWNLANLNGSTIADVASGTFAFYGVQETNFTLAEPVSAGASTTSSIAVTGLMTVASIGSGVLESGQFLSGTGIPSNANAQILYQVTGTAGSTGTYQTNLMKLVTSTTIVAVAGQIGAITSWAGTVGA